MMQTRHGNTAKEIAVQPDWMKVGRKHYLHGSGAEVVYDCNRWGWRLTGAGAFDGLYVALWVAKGYAEKFGREAR
jgi:hypothetical protein